MGERDEHVERDPLLTELRELIGRADPVPESLNEAARGAYTWRTIDAELAALTHDSAFEDEAAVLVRGEAGPRLLSFEAPRLAIEVEVLEPSPQHRQLVGQLAPALRATIEVDHAGGLASAESDALGRFVIDGVRAGPARLRCRLTAGTPPEIVTTEWTQL
jgi:hypothetical protein